MHRQTMAYSSKLQCPPHVSLQWTRYHHVSPSFQVLLDEVQMDAFDRLIDDEVDALFGEEEEIVGTDAAGFLVDRAGGRHEPEADFDGQFLASSSLTTVARLRTGAKAAAAAPGDMMFDVTRFEGQAVDPAFRTAPFDATHLRTTAGVGAEVARMSAGRDGWWYKELTANAADPWYAAAHAFPWTAGKWAARVAPDPNDARHQAYLRAARQHNRTRPKGTPRVSESTVPAHWSAAPADYGLVEGPTKKSSRSSRSSPPGGQQQSADERKFVQGMAPLGSIYHAPAYDCLVASGGSAATRAFALQLALTRWRLNYEGKHLPWCQPPWCAEWILDCARIGAANHVGNMAALAARIRRAKKAGDGGPPTTTPKPRRRRRRGGRRRRRGRRRVGVGGVNN